MCLSQWSHLENKLINSKSKNYMTANDTTQKIKCRKAQVVFTKEWVCLQYVCLLYSQCSFSAIFEELALLLTPKIIWLHLWAYWSLVDTLVIFKSFSSSQVLPKHLGKSAVSADLQITSIYSFELRTSGNPKNLQRDTTYCLLSAKTKFCGERAFFYNTLKYEEY